MWIEFNNCLFDLRKVQVILINEEEMNLKFCFSNEDVLTEHFDDLEKLQERLTSYKKLLGILAA
jgi:hypothetical protein